MINEIPSSSFAATIGEGAFVKIVLLGVRLANHATRISELLRGDTGAFTTLRAIVPAPFIEWLQSGPNLVASRINAVLARIGPRSRSERTIAAAIVALVHAILLLVLLEALVPRAVKPSRELSIELVGGPLGAAVEKPKPPDLADVTPQDVPPPLIEIETPDAVGDTVKSAAGTPNVTRPAMALADAHAFPVLLAAYPSNRKLSVRLLLSVARDGSISDATVSQSSGAASLDQTAIDWVKAHWRYQPALEQGQTVAVTTIAVVAFARPT